MFGGTLPRIKWITWSWSRIGGSNLGVSNTLEWLSKSFWRYGEIYYFDVWTFSEHNCEIMPHVSLFRSFFMPLEMIIFLGFLVIPLNSTSFPSQKNFKKSSWKLKALIPKDWTIGLLVQHQHHPLEWKALEYSIHIPPWLDWYYVTFQINL